MTSRAFICAVALAAPDAERFALFVMSLQGQQVLARYGFTPGGSP
jgi:ABC-type molybdate transport system substrate-binding protein